MTEIPDGGVRKRLFGGGAAFCSLLLLAGAVSADPIAFTKTDAKTAYEVADAFVKECSPRDGGTLRGKLAAGWLQDRASRCGADAAIDAFRSRTLFGDKDYQNVMVEFPGTRTNAGWIVVMSHYDTAPLAKKPFVGANDGASTSGLLVALAGAIRRAGPQTENIALVWTDGEECEIAYGPHDGFHGSKRLVGLFREKGRRVKAAVCLDMLGDEDLNVIIPANTTPQLKKLALRAADIAGVGKHVAVNDSIVVSDDHTAFLNAGCPAIDFIDFAYGPDNSWWHTPQDTMAHVSADSLEISGRLAAAFINLLCR